MYILKNFIPVLAILLAFGACNHNNQSQDLTIAIVPQPNELTQQEGSFTVNSRTVFVVSEDESLTAAVALINQRFSRAAGFSLKVAGEKPKKNFIAVELDPALVGGAEAYELLVEPQGVTVKAGTARGAFYGLATMLQLLPSAIESPEPVTRVNWTMPCVQITDQPRFVWRGMHLDVCRHFVPVEFIKKQLDVMALFKMNTFHWHLTEDQGWRIEIKKYPKLTELGSVRILGDGSKYGGFYTQEEVKEVVAYAAERFIDVVPEIELPGHSLAALVGYPQLSCTGGPFRVRNVWGVEPDVYCAGKDETFQFLEDIINEVVPLFPYEYFHIGGDECPKDRWKKCPDCQKRIRREGLKDEHELQSYFVQRIEKVLLAHGKKMIGWDEILEGGLAPSATVMSWRGEAGGIEAAQQGHDVVMTPGNWVYLDHYQGSSQVEPVAIGGYTTLEESYGYDPVPAELDGEKAKHVLGTQGNVWSEYLYTPEMFEYRIYPRIIALAEVGWTEKANKDYTDFLRRMDPQFERLDYHGINYHIPLPEGPVNQVAFTDEATLEFTTTRPVKMVYTLDGQEPDLNSAVYESPLVFTENATVKIRSVLNSGKMSRVRTIQVEKQDLLPAVTVQTTGTGLKGQYAKGYFTSVKDIESVDAWTDMTLTKETLAKINDYQDPTGAVLTGYIEIAEDGVYEFQTNFDQFLIGEKLLINNDGEVKRFSRNNAMIALEKGKHPVKIIYLNNNIGGFPQSWNHFVVEYKKGGDEKFTRINPENYTY
ncbi:family 20 glycosylhydrolase [Gaoshiqia sp. Z1-71]|uniref:family 20 glycosylhydrolase n=1 Tax=Gaoshiqia hydrogeniformans TaxID=3290090 RepID=UPI003BF8E7D7